MGYSRAVSQSALAWASMPPWNLKRVLCRKLSCSCFEGFPWLSAYYVSIQTTLPLGPSVQCGSKQSVWSLSEHLAALMLQGRMLHWCWCNLWNTVPSSNTFITLPCSFNSEASPFVLLFAGKIKIQKHFNEWIKLTLLALKGFCNLLIVDCCAEEMDLYIKYFHIIHNKIQVRSNETYYGWSNLNL